MMIMSNSFFVRQMSTFFERYEEAMPMNPAVARLTKLIVLMTFAAHLAVRNEKSWV